MVCCEFAVVLLWCCCGIAVGLLWHSSGPAVQLLWFNCFFDCYGILIFLQYLIDVGLLQACCCGLTMVSMWACLRLLYDC